MKRCQVPLFDFLLGRPRGRHVDSSRSREAVRFCHGSVPYGLLLRMLRWTASSSAAVIEGLSPRSQPGFLRLQLPGSARVACMSFPLGRHLGPYACKCHNTKHLSMRGMVARI
jgi:hypothetical protein